jgi:hypothetical protein
LNQLDFHFQLPQSISIYQVGICEKSGPQKGFVAIDVSIVWLAKRTISQRRAISAPIWSKAGAIESEITQFSKPDIQ